MNHAFLTREGVWNTEGRFFDAGGAGFAAKGRMRVVHARGLWILQSSLNVEYPDRPLDYSNLYEFTPLAKGQRLTWWTSGNHAFGRQKGRIAIVDDAMLSDFVSEDGVITGHECLILNPGGSYLDRGMVLRNGEPLASWSLTVRPWGD